MTSSASAPFVLISEAFVAPDAMEDAQRLWVRPLPCDDRFTRLVYRGKTDDVMLDLTAFERLEQLDEILASRREFEAEASGLLRGDWRRQILTHVEDVKPGTGPLPASPGLELRHIEVPPPVYPEYRDWRARTIFPAVKKRSEVEQFLAYHSVVSGAPGVMFIVGFSCDDADYTQVYETPEYREILRQAGGSFIAGGLSGLDTRIYHRLSA